MEIRVDKKQLEILIQNYYQKFGVFGTVRIGYEAVGNFYENQSCSYAMKATIDDKNSNEKVFGIVVLDENDIKEVLTDYYEQLGNKVNDVILEIEMPVDQRDSTYYGAKIKVNNKVRKKGDKNGNK